MLTLQDALAASVLRDSMIKAGARLQPAAHSGAVRVVSLERPQAGFLDWNDEEVDVPKHADQQRQWPHQEQQSRLPEIAQGQPRDTWGCG